MSEIENTGNEIAIIGMSCRVPGAKNLDQFWSMLKEGNESIHRFSDEELRELGISEELIKDDDYVKANNVLEENELFDASYFEYSAREAELMDPQQRIFLEGAVEALNNAGIVSEDYEGDIGLFAGCGKNDYFLQNLVGDKKLSLAESYKLMIGNEKDFLTTRTAYLLGLTGPALNINTACSTSLVAIHTACQSILNGECDVALAGGVSVSLPQNEGYYYQEGMIMSPDGKCRSFDAKAKGTIPGRGVGIVVLKPLEDALEDKDHIYAVIKGSAINNDGKDKIGYTAPSVNGQSAVIEEALEVAEVNPETISFMEAHGTATPMGDPIEIKALTQAWSKYTDKKEYCSLGSLKSNIGHTDAAAGVLGLIKTALSLHNKQIPASLHFETPNPEIDFENSPFRMNTSLKEWKNNDYPLRAAISAFGIGGTNAHAILEEAPITIGEKEEVDSTKNHLLVLSAKSEASLKSMSTELADYLEKYPRTNLSDVANTLISGRTPFKHRVSVAATNLTTAISSLRSAPSQVVNSLPKTAFLFSGQGSQYMNMAKELYESSSVFKGCLDYCAKVLYDILSVDIKALLFTDNQSDKKEEVLINDTQYTQPLLFSIEYSLAKLLKAKGVNPDIMIGHSIGEYTAACLAGVFTLEDTLKIVSERGRLMQQMDKGDMLAVSLSAEEITPWLNDRIELALVNSTGHVVVGGKTEDIGVLEQNLVKKSIGCQILSTSHAFHTSMMDPMLEEFSLFMKQISYSTPTIPFVSNVTGELITAEEATSVMHWVKQLRNTVQFAQGIECLLSNHANILIEVGPGKTLCSFAKMQIQEKPVTTIATIPHSKDQTPSDLFFLNSLGKFWQAGGEIELTQFSQGFDSVKIPLPGYAFDRKRHWVNVNGKERSVELEQDSKDPKNTESLGSIEEIMIEIWSNVFGIKNIDESDNFFELGGDSLMAVECASLLKKRAKVRVEVRHFVEYPTIAELTGFIKAQSSSEDLLDSRLVHIKKGKSEIPLICIHPAGGTIFPFITMANYLPKEQTVYAIQSISLEEERSYSGIKDRSKKYIDLIKTIQPEGPYHLSGWSFGGNVALEMGIQLTKNGDEVTFLGLFDSFPPESYPSNPNLDNVKFLISFVITISEAFGVSSMPKVKDLYTELHNFSIDECWEILSKGVFQDPVFEKQKLSSLKNIFEMFKIHVHELCSQELENTTIPITWFNAKDGFAQKFNDVLNMNTDLDFVLQCWENYSDRPINHFEASGNHSTMLNDPHAKSLALKLSEIIRDV